MKRKYIYEISCNRIGQYHYERYPIIYENNDVIYFKRAGVKTLGLCYKESIKVSLYDIDRPLNKYEHIYLYNEPTVTTKENLEKFIYDSFIENRYRYIDRTIEKCNNTIRKAEEEKAYLDGLKNDERKMSEFMKNYEFYDSIMDIKQID